MAIVVLMACSSGLAVLMALLLQEFCKIKPFDREVQELSEPSPPTLQVSDLTEAELRDLSGPIASPAVSIRTLVRSLVCV